MSVGMVMRPEDDPGWASYADTILEFHGDDTVTLDLRGSLLRSTIAKLGAMGLEGEFGLVTPCNPRGRDISEHENQARLESFFDSLIDDGVPYVVVDGWSRDRSRVERGAGIARSQATVLAIARGWEQSAIYWCDGSRFWVVGALTQVEPWLLMEVSE
jgi:hypothetical protein